MSRNVVFIYLDSVRKDYFDEYAPRLAALADTSFEQCRAPSGWSLPSHASLLSGTLAHQHGISPKGQQTFEALPLSETFLSRLPNHMKIGVSGNTFASEAFAFDQYFDDFITYSGYKLFQRGQLRSDIVDPAIDSAIRRYAAFVRTSLSEPYPLRTLGNGVYSKVAAGRWLLSALPGVTVSGGDATRMSQTARQLVTNTDEPYFLFMNYMDAHSPFTDENFFSEGPYDVPNEWHSDTLPTDVRITPEPFDDHQQDRDYYRDLYANSIDYLDRTLEPFIRWLVDTANHETTVVVTADHGESLGYPDDEYMIGHSNLCEAIAHVPFVVVNPPDSSPELIDEYTSHLDVGDLLVEFANDCPVPESIGRDRVFAEVLRAGGIKRSDSEDIPHLNRAVRSLWDSQTRFVWDSNGHCDEYTVDPDKPTRQTHVRSLNSPPEVEQTAFDAPIGTFADIDSAGIDVSETTEDRLRELGYL
ncbi:MULTISPECIES: sulfatase-like hydrolase/transferase [unclassified Haloarcula]|uniref:sulfatase-like hydrolase/transferase n=1 Tax=unclassified Haloarcula TaxID=2624677 RepID=UPI00073F8D5F|nr:MULTISPECIES: sulfatase-like hydrolase/transferase [unclassified Haloarcula]